MLYAIVTLLVIIADQWVKFWVAGNIPINRGFMEVIPGFLSIVNIHNDGAAFSFLSGENASIIFIGLALLVTVVVIILLATRIVKNGLARWSLVFIMAGGLGNCLDRIIYGYVQDMFRFDFVNFAIFNVADIFITVFCVLFILAVIFGRSGRDEDEEDEYYDDDDEEEEEAEEEEDEEPVMSRRERKKAEREAKKAAKLAKKKAEEEYDDEEEEDDMVAVSKRPAPAVEEPTGRKARQQKLDEDYEKFKANRASRPAINSEPTRRAAAVDPANPFAEWESIPGADNRPRPAAPAAKPAAPAAKPAAAAVKPAAPAAKPAAPAVKPAAPAVEDEFDLDSILEEFGK